MYSVFFFIQFQNNAPISPKPISLKNLIEHDEHYCEPNLSIFAGIERLFFVLLTGALAIWST